MNSDRKELQEKGSSNDELAGVKAPESPLETPDYLRKIYWWAYEHPRAVWFWDRDFLIDFILLGNYKKLSNAVLEEFSTPLNGNNLQISCAYGKLTPRLQQQLGPDGRLDVVDVLNVQLENVRPKLRQPDDRIRLIQGDACDLQCADGTYDRVLMFFLPHELPEERRRVAIAEAFRVVKPGGSVVFVEFHRPNLLHPLRLWQRLVFLLFEPFAADMWRYDLTYYFPADLQYTVTSKTTYFGSLYQRLIVRREA